MDKPELKLNKNFWNELDLNVWNKLAKAVFQISEDEDPYFSAEGNYDFVDSLLDDDGDKYNENNDFVQKYLKLSFTNVLDLLKKHYFDDDEYDLSKREDNARMYSGVMNCDMSLSNKLTKVAHQIHLINDDEKILYTEHTTDLIRNAVKEITDLEKLPFAKMNLDNLNFTHDVKNKYDDKQIMKPTHASYYYLVKSDNSLLKIDDPIAFFLTDIVDAQTYYPNDKHTELNKALLAYIPKD